MKSITGLFEQKQQETQILINRRNTMTHKKYLGKTFLALAAVLAVCNLFAVGSLSAATLGYWRFESGAFQDNTVGSANDLTGTGSPTQTALTATGPGKDFPDPIPQNGLSNGDAVDFDGSNRFESGDVSGGDFTSGGMTATIEMFFNADAFDSGTTFMTSIWGSGSDKQFVFGVSNNQLRVVLGDGNGDTDGVTFSSLPGPSTTLSTGNDYYAALVIDGPGSVTGYLQDLTGGGSLVSLTGSTSLNNSFSNSSQNLSIGADGSNSNNFAGLIDEVRVSNSALSQSELLVVPEPSSIMLLGLCGLLLMKRRRL